MEQVERKGHQLRAHSIPLLEEQVEVTERKGHQLWALINYLLPLQSKGQQKLQLQSLHFSKVPG